MAKAPTNPFVAKLKKQKSAWDAGKEEMKKTDGFSDLQPNRYWCRLMSMELKDKDGKLGVRFLYKVIQGECAGQKQSAYDGLETELNYVHFGRKLEKIGYETDKLDITEIPELCDDYNALEYDAKAICEIKVAWDGQYTNVYLNDVLDEDAAAAFEDESPEEEEESKPKSAPKRSTPKKSASGGTSSSGSAKGAKGTKGTKGAKGTKGTKGTKAAPPPEPEPAEDKWVDWGADADDGDEEAKATLLAECEARGIDDTQYATWTLLGEFFDSDEGDDEGDEGDVEIGMRVAVERRGKEVQGEITEINEDDSTVKVKPDSGRSFTVSVDAIEILDE